MEQSFFALFRKHVNDNLGLIIALLSAVFAGWSAYEAYAARNDAIASLKIAQRSYIDVQEHTVTWSKAMLSTGEPILQYSHTVTVYGNSPAFQVKETSICSLGAESLFERPKGLTLDDLQFVQVRELPTRQRLPAEIIPGSKHSSDVACSYLPNKTKFPGALVYGVVNYEDLFGDKHQKHFCYYNRMLEPKTIYNAAIAAAHPRPEAGIEAEKHLLEDETHLIACDIFNDEVSGEAANKLNLVEAPNTPDSTPSQTSSPAPSQAPAPK